MVICHSNGKNEHKYNEQKYIERILIVFAMFYSITIFPIDKGGSVGFAQLSNI